MVMGQGLAVPATTVGDVLLVEDHPATREALADALASRSGLAVVGVASRAEAAGAVARQRVVFAFVDLRLGDDSGIDVIRDLSRKSIPCVALSVVDDSQDVLAALRAGARGYLLKSDRIERLVAAIGEALGGESPLSGGIAHHLVEAIQPSELPVELTERERDVLVALARGLTYQEAADALGLKLGTVQGYVKAIYAKLDVTSKTEACAWALRHGLVT